MALAIHMLAVLLLALAFGQALALALSVRPAAMSGRRGAVPRRRQSVLATPHFTHGGLLGDLGGILALLALLLASPHGDAAFWLIAVALSLMLASQLLFWSASSATAASEQPGPPWMRASLALLGLLAIILALGV